MAKKDNKKISRSAVTGQFISPEYAKRHPKTTVQETISQKPKKKSKKEN